MSYVRLVVAVAAGGLLVIALQGLSPFIGRLVYQRAFEAAYMDCALSQQHAADFREAPIKPALRMELGKTLEVEQLRCLDYASLKLKLESFRVPNETIASIELSALAKNPELRCDSRCDTVIQR